MGYTYYAAPEGDRSHIVPKRTQHWHHEKRELTGRGDLVRLEMFKQTSLGYVKNKAGQTLFHVHLNDSWDTWKVCTWRTLKQAWNNGNDDMEVWAYANPGVKPKDAKKDLRTGKWRFYDRQDIEAPGKSFIVDLDKTKFDTVTHMEEYLRYCQKQNGLPLPNQIITTSPNCYHLVYKIGAGEQWERHHTERLHWNLCGRSTSEINKMSPKDLVDEIKELGVDPSVMSLAINSPGKTKYRLPGTINKSKNVLVGCKSLMPGRTALVLFIFQHGNTEVSKVTMNMEEYFSRELDDLFPSQLEDYSGQMGPYAKSVSRFFKSCVMNCGFTEKVSDHMASMYGWLKSNNCEINQAKMAAASGLSQPYVSKLLKIMIKKRLIVVINDVYCIGMFSKKYGLHPSIRAEITDQHDAEYSRKQKARSRYNLLEDYADGSVHNHFNRDIIYLVGQGVDDAYITDIIGLKMDNRPMSSQRRGRDIERSIAGAHILYDTGRMGWYKRTKVVIDIPSMISALGGCPMEKLEEESKPKIEIGDGRPKVSLEDWRGAVMDPANLSTEDHQKWLDQFAPIVLTMEDEIKEKKEDFKKRSRDDARRNWGHIIKDPSRHDELPPYIKQLLSL